MTVSSRDTRWKQAASSGSEVRDLWNRVGSTRNSRVSAAEWWSGVDQVQLNDNPRSDPDAWLGMAMFKRALQGGPPVHLANFEGNLVVPSVELIKTIEQIVNVKPVRYIHVSGGTDVLLSGDETMVSFGTYNGGKGGTIRCATISEEVVQKLSQLARGVLRPDDPSEGLVFGLAKSPMGGYHLTKVGVAGETLERGNYEENVLKQFDHVIDDMNVAAPCGRLTIFSGVPGSGKTFLVRALLKSVPSSAFILVPSYLIRDLGSPEILPTLANLKHDGFKGPITLLLEDADQALVNREKGDIAAISSLLNLGDGILGNILDIRLIATTNAAKLDMDEATRREGRLCSYIEVNRLSVPKAASVMERLTGKKLTPKGPMTLAQCYLAARKLGWTPPVIEPKSPYRPELLNSPQL